MAKPQRLKSGRYAARIMRDGKRIRLGTFATSREAELAQAKALLNPDEERRGQQRFHKYANTHIQIRKDDLASGSWANFVRSYKKHLEPTFGHKKLCDISPAMVKRWWIEMANTPGPRRAAYMVLSNIMRAAVSDGEIVRSPCNVPKASKDVSTVRPIFAPDDIAFLRLLSTDPQVTTILWVLVASGLRISEVLPLTWADIDLERGSLHVNKHLTRHGIMPGRKSHPDADNYQPITGSAVEALAALRATRDDVTGAAFLNSFGEPLSYHAWFARWDELRKLAAMPTLRAHDIRAVHLTAFGGVSSLKEVMERGGHSDYRSALRYQRPSPERQREIVSQLTF